MTYLFRLVFASTSNRVFMFEKATMDFEIENGKTFTITARDAEKLLDAKKFHIESKGYRTEDLAREAGEHVRTCMRLLNSILNLGLNVPQDNTVTSWFNESVKEVEKESTGRTLHDGTFGLIVFPDDGSHVEASANAEFNVHTSVPEYIFEALKTMWPLSFTFDLQSEESIEVLNKATRETSPRTRFLLMYMALELLFPRTKREEKTINLIETFISQVSNSDLNNSESQTLKSALGGLKYHSFKSIFYKYLELIQEPTEIEGQSLKDFFGECIYTRHCMAHDHEIRENIDLNRLCKGLNSFILSLIWTRNELASVSIDRPADAVSPEKPFQFRYF